jgi:plasmid maintenance system antidote protein VapI
VTASRSGRPSRAALTPAALAERLGLAEWQVHRAQLDGLIPGRDRSKGWSADLADKIAVTVEGRRDELLAEIGTVPDMGAYDCALWLARVDGPGHGSPVYSETVRELHHLHHLAAAGWSGDYRVYDGRSIEAFAARADVGEVLAAAAVTGRTLMASQVAERLGVRRVDVDHLARAGLLRPVNVKLAGHTSKSRDPGMALYRAGDIDELAAWETVGGVPWETVRGLKPGQRSPWAKLPNAPKGDRHG